MIRFAAALLLLAALTSGGCGNASGTAELKPFAKVRVTAPLLGPGWHVAEVGTVGECLMLLVPQPPDEPRRLVPVPFDDVTEVQLSGEGSGEQWLPVDLAAVHREHGGCSPLP